MPNCLGTWGDEADCLADAIELARGGRTNPGWATELATKPPYDGLERVRDALDTALGNAPAPRPPRWTGGPIPPGLLEMCCDHLEIKLDDDKASGCHVVAVPPLNWLNLGLVPPPDPAHIPIPDPAAVARALDLRERIRLALAS